MAANDHFVFLADRDFGDLQDVYRCFNAQTGQQLWEVSAIAIGQLDYGNSPRATPLIAGTQVIFFGAMGNLVAVDILSGKPNWRLNVRKKFGAAAELPWGYCGSPLLIGKRLIINPGSEEASLVALDVGDGSTLWQTSGDAAAYGSFIVANFGNRDQIVGHDAESLGGWDVKDGRRLWRIEPESSHEFNVPTPVVVGDKLLVCTEQMGTRMYGFSSRGLPEATPLSHNRMLRPDMSSPVVVGSRLFCVNRFLYCLDVTSGLEEQWRIRDKALSDYASIITSDDRLLVIGDGELLLMRTDGSRDIVGRQQIFKSPDCIYSHPALVGDRLYIRGETRLKCISLAE